MTDIARLGFDIDTSTLSKANAELRNLVNNANYAEQAVLKLATSTSSVGTRVAANINAMSVAMAQVSAGAGNAAAAVARSNAAMVANTNTTRAATTATTQAAAAQTASAVAANSLAGAHVQVAANTNRSTAAVNSHSIATKAASNAVSTLNEAFALAAKGAALLAGYFGISAIVEAINKYTQLTNTLRMNNITGNDAIIVQQKLFEIADKNGVPIGETIKLYQRQSIAAKALGASQLDMLNVIDITAAALRIQGTTAEGARGALLQLSQSFESGIVHAQEFNSLLQNAYPVVQAAARGMDGMSGSVGKLQAAVRAGTVTSQQFFAAILKGGKETIAQAQNMELQLSAAFTVITNSFTELVGKIDDATGISKTIVGWGKDIGQWMQDLSKNKGFLDWMADEWGKVKNAVSATIQEIKDLITFFGKAIDMARSIGREIATTQLGGQLKDATADVKAAQDALAAGERRLQSLQAQSPTGARDKNIILQSMEVGRLERAYTAAAAARDSLAIKQANVMIGSPSTVPGPDEQDFWQGPRPSTLGTRGKPDDPITKAGHHKAMDPYQKILLDANQFIIGEKLKEQQLGKTEVETLKLEKAQELINKAQDRNIALTPTQIAQLTRLGDAMGEAKAKFDAAKDVADFEKASKAAIANANAEVAALGMGTEAAMAYRLAQELINKEIAKGIVLTDEQIGRINAAAAAQAKAVVAADRQKQLWEAGREAFKGFFSDLTTNLRQGMTLWDAFADAAQKALNKIADKLMEFAMDQVWDLIKKQIEGALGGGGGGGGGLGGLISGIIGGGGQAAGVGGAEGFFAAAESGIGAGVIAAKGAAFNHGNVIPFARGGVVSSPMMSPMALMGEAGPEGILPLRRGSDGRLGVMSSGNGSGGSNTVIHLEVSGDNEWVRAVARDESGKIVATAAPRITDTAVTKSRQQVVPTTNRNRADREGEWRV
jgi:tape measure domain-containing protein